MSTHAMHGSRTHCLRGLAHAVQYRVKPVLAPWSLRHSLVMWVTVPFRLSRKANRYMNASVAPFVHV
jgi:hypothetical protein